MEDTTISTDADSTSMGGDEPVQLTPAALAIARAGMSGVSEPSSDVDDQGEDLEVQETHDARQLSQPADEPTINGGSKDAAGATWVNEEAKTLAANYGLDEETLQDFGSRAELDKFARIQDKLLMGTGKSQATSSAPATFQPGQEPTASGTQTAAEVENQQKQTPGQISLNPEDWAKEGYDEKTVGLVKAFSEQQANFQRVQEYIAHQQHVQHVNQFHDVVDSLGDKRFGKSVVNGSAQPVPEAQSAERQKVYNAAAELEAGIVARAQKLGVAPQVPPLPELIRRAYNAVYGDDIKANATKEAQQKILAQSRNRRPVASTRTNAPVPATAPHDGETQMEIAARIAADPRVAGKFKNMQRENGAAV